MPHGFLLHHLISLTPSSLSERLARLVSTFRLVCFRLAEGCVLRDLLDSGEPEEGSVVSSRLGHAEHVEEKRDSHSINPLFFYPSLNMVNVIS